MKLEIVRYNETLRKIWDELVDNSINGTFLHNRNFFDHNPLNTIDDHSLLFYKKNEAVALIPFNNYEQEGQLILNSHLRSTYGGFVINHQVGVEEALEIVEQVIAEARRISAHKIIIRNPFRIFHHNSCDETDYAMWYHGFQVNSRALEAVIKLGEVEQMEKSYAHSTIGNIKKAKQLLVVEQSDDFNAYWNILTANLESKHATKPTHSIEQFHTLLTKIGNQKIKLFVAKLNDQIIAGIIVFIVNTTSLHAQYVAYDLNFQLYRPLDLLIDNISNWGYKNGYQYFNLGTANENDGKSINHGLFKFKERFGARGILRETMVLTLK